MLVVIPHDGDDDAVRIANDSPYGLSGSVYVGRPRAGAGPSPAASAPARSASTAASGTRGDVPFGGYKQSGIGREMGVAGFEEYLETKSIAEGVMRRRGMHGSTDKVAIVTGAAGGIGEAYARALAAEGASVVVADLERRRAASESPTSIDAGGGAAIGVAVDVSDPALGRRRWPPRPSRRSAASTCWSTTPPSTATCSSTC